MSATTPTGWRALMEGFPWLDEKGSFPLPAYSEFMPPPRLGRKPVRRTRRPCLFRGDDLSAGRSPRSKRSTSSSPGSSIWPREIVGALVRLGRGKPEFRHRRPQGPQPVDNPYWPPELPGPDREARHERYVVLLPLALARTQDDKGRVRWTFFGSSEQGPEQAFWKGFRSAPGREIPASGPLAFLAGLLSAGVRRAVKGPAGPRASRLRAPGSGSCPRSRTLGFPYWHESCLPSWTAPLVIDEAAAFDDVRYLLTFRPFARLPPRMSGDDIFQGSSSSCLTRGASFLGRARLYPPPGKAAPGHADSPLSASRARHGAPGGVRIPQSGWLHEAGAGRGPRNLQGAAAQHIRADEPLGPRPPPRGRCGPEPARGQGRQGPLQHRAGRIGPLRQAHGPQLPDLDRGLPALLDGPERDAQPGSTPPARRWPGRAFPLPLPIPGDAGRTPRGLLAPSAGGVSGRTSMRGPRSCPERPWAA